MNDREICRVVLAWSEMSSLKRKKVFKEYQNESPNARSSSRQMSPKWRLLQARAKQLDREEFLSLLGPKINARDSFRIMRMFEGAFGEILVALCGGDKSFQNTFCLQVWERAGPALLGCPENRDSLLAV